MKKGFHKEEDRKLRAGMPHKEQEHLGEKPLLPD